MASTKPEFHVPGAYTFDNPPPFSAPCATSPPHRSSGLAANVYRPPAASAIASARAGITTPPASGTIVLNMAKSTSSVASDVSMTPVALHANTKRKRAIQDSSRETTPLPADWGSLSIETDGGSERISYTLAGQIDTAGGAVSGSIEDSVYSDIDYRRALGPTAWPTPHGEDMPKATSSGNGSENWTVLHALGTVVGKVWNFCTSGAFRGFHAAGGGAGYDWETGRLTVDNVPGTPKKRDGLDDEPDPTFTAPADVEPTAALPRTGKRRQVSTAGDELGRNWVLVPPDGANDTPRSTSSTSTSRRLPGRLSVTTARASLSTPTTTSRRSGLPARRTNMPVPPVNGGHVGTTETTLTARGAAATIPGGNRLRVSHAGSPGLSSRVPASFASPRSPGARATATTTITPRGAWASTTAATPATTPRRSGMAAREGRLSPAAMAGRISGSARGRGNPFARVASSTASAARPGSRSSSHRRVQSNSSSGGGGGGVRPQRTTMAEEGGDYDAVKASPRLTEEAKQLAAQKWAAEQDADAKMEALNRQLQEMIRQGQEALGTRFEVDMDDGNNDWNDRRRDPRHCDRFWVEE